MERDYPEGLFLRFSLRGMVWRIAVCLLVFGFSSLLRQLSNGLVFSEYRICSDKMANWDYGIISCGVFIVFR